MARTETIAAAKGRVLVVDDEPTNRELLLAIFEDVQDVELATAASGEEALKVAAEFRPDLVLLDIMMPGIDGYEVCRRMRAHSQLKHAKLLLVSAKAMPEERVVGYRAGADDYIVKPIDDEEMLAKVRVFLRLKFTEEIASDLRIAKAHAEEMSKAKDAFVATMSHEIRTPMNGIVGSLDLLRRTALAGEQVELVQVMHRSAGALLRVINDILDFAKLESGHLVLERVPFDLSVLLAEVVDLERNAAETKGLAVNLTISQEVPKALLGDPWRLRQVLLNLLDNAVKFTATGTIDLICEPDATTGLMRFVVSDTGVGISANALDRIFDAFAQEDASTTRRFGGSGLGLAICKHMVGLMGGTIVAKSAPGKGSSFVFTCALPVAAALSAEPDPSEADGQTRFDARVLVVDDNAANRLLATKMLQSLGCKVTTASSGREALELVAAHEFELILMDCSMPDMDGFETTRRIRGINATLGTTPIVAMTAYAMPGDRARCLESGMDDYLSKPVRIAELAKTIKRVGLRVHC